jgi:CRISPR-associated endonuclease Cas2
MARPEHLYIFAYDIVHDSKRTKVHALLSEHLTPVQKSVFEGRLTAEFALKLGKKVSVMIGPDDNLRIYCVTEAGRRASFAFGDTPLPEAQDFVLL